MKHLAVCVMVKGERVGFVISGRCLTKLERWAETFKNRIGYVGEDDFALAIRRAGMMERDEKDAWGVIA